MITSIISTVPFLQQSEQKLITEYKSLILARAYYGNKSVPAPYGTPPVREEKITSSVPIPILGIELQVDNNVPSLV